MTDTRPVTFRRTRVAPDLLPESAVLIDQLRERTLWAEGMFVTAQHFNRDQSYLITRQGDLGQAIGKGVVEGLKVTAVEDDPTALTVAPGLGIGGGGESIVLHTPTRIPLGDIALQRALTREAGLTDSLKLIAESRSGLFVLCATPVEYSSNPIGSYATTAGGQRRLQDSVVNEATLFTLVPYALNATAGSSEARHAEVARRIFVDGKMADIPPASLPLAMVELEGNVLVWMDQDMVRREAGADRADAFGLGFVDTPGRIAHFRQYDAVLAEMLTAAPGQAFAAADRFAVLPPMGRMPAACVVPRRPVPGADLVLSHNWLPAEMPVELVALPEDEIEQLLEESLTMPPIDLGAKPEALAQMPVSIIVPVPRADWAETPTELVQQALTLAPAAPLGGQPKTPIALIRTLLEQEADWDLIDPTVSAEWLALLAGRTTLWYARRRQFLRTDALAGEAFRFQVNPPGTEPEEPEEPEEPPAPVPEPVEPPASAPDTAGPLVELWNESVARALVPWGLDRLYRAVRSQDNAAGREARAALNAALLDALGADSPVAATHLLHLATGSRDPDPIEEFRALLRDAEAFRRFAPFEGLLTGGLIDFRVPNFPSRVTAPQSPPDLLTRANLNQRPRAAPGLQLPSAMPTRTSRLLTTLEIERGTLRSIVLHGGGQVPLRAPRNLEVLTEALKVALENEVPVIVRARDPGSVEAQTRRNLLAFTKRVPEMVKRLATDDLGRRLGDYIGHLEAMEEAMTSDFQGANRTVRRSVRRLLQGT